ncbi:MAG TPA: hypothetical protein DCS93_16580 [Microscillaceae bacterium]|nr:hypothetical protein [Microscillaceae bacterium]
MKGILQVVTYFLLGGLGSITVSWAQSSTWQAVKRTGKGDIVVYHNPVRDFFEVDNDKNYKGIEYDLLTNFVAFTEKKYGVKIKVKFKLFDSFAQLYDSILVAPSGVFAVSSMSITPKRLRVLKFSPPYMRDTEVIVSSKQLPNITDTADFVKQFKGMTAVVVRNTTYEENLKKLKKSILPNLKIAYVANTAAVRERLQTEPNVISYAQITMYLRFRKAGVLIDRQNLFKVDKIGKGVAFSTKSDWDEPVQLFFNAPSFRPMINQIIKKYLGENEKALFWAVNSNNPNVQELALINKEKELQDLEILRQQNTINSQKDFRNYLIAGLILVLSVAFTLYYLFQNKKRTNNLLKQKNNEISEQREQLKKQTDALKFIAEELESQRDTIEDTNKLLSHKNKKITDSIRSAEAIQQAILPLDARLRENFTDHFVFYKPKDIVSGDFYWLSDVQTKKSDTQTDDKTLQFSTPSSVPFDPLSGYSNSPEEGLDTQYCFIAVVDCTGHGVPGAFMSMMGFAYLNQTVNEHKVLDPAQILQTLHSEIHQGLKQSETNNDEGMDICLCRIEQKLDGSYEVLFAGAKRPLYYVKNGQLHEVRGNAASIGGWQKQMQKSFENNSVYLNKGDLLYLSTDGYIDTPNPERKNFSTVKFKELLQENFRLPLSKQKDVFEQALLNHQQDADQRDDITLIGVKF